MAIGGTPASPAFIGSWFDSAATDSIKDEVRRVYTYPNVTDQFITRTIKTYVQQKITSTENLAGLAPTVAILDSNAYFPDKEPLASSSDSFTQPEGTGTSKVHTDPKITQVKVDFSPMGVASCTATFTAISTPSKIGEPIPRKMVDAETPQ
jgi:hypothetical protein